jgi:hypothetical protein
MRLARRPIALLLLVWFLPACATYQPTELAPHEKVKLSGASSTEVTVREPWVRADSIGGVTDLHPDWSVPLASVAEIKTSRFNPALTVVGIVGGVAVAVGGFYFVACVIGGGDC